MVLDALRAIPDNELLQLWYSKLLQHFKPVAEDIAHYKLSRWNGSMTTHLSGSGEPPVDITPCKRPQKFDLAIDFKLKHAMHPRMGCGGL